MRIETIEQYMEAMRATFSPERAGDARAVLQYEFSGRQCGTCHAVIAGGAISVALGPHPAPTAVVRCDFDLWLAILAHKVDGLMAGQEGGFSVEGDPELLMDSNAWFLR